MIVVKHKFPLMRTG